MFGVDANARVLNADEIGSLPDAPRAWKSEREAGRSHLVYF